MTQNYNPDQPVSSEKDSFRRVPFAKSLAKALILPKDSPGIDRCWNRRGLGFREEHVDWIYKRESL